MADKEEQYPKETVPACPHYEPVPNISKKIPFQVYLFIVIIFTAGMMVGFGIGAHLAGKKCPTAEKKLKKASDNQVHDLHHPSFGDAT